MKDPSFIIQLKDETVQKEVRFQELFTIKENIINMTILWDFNSYFIDITNRYMVVNGGRRIELPNLTVMEKPKFYYRRRHTSILSVSGKEVPKKRTAYIIGAEGRINGIITRVYILIEESGSVAKIVDNEIVN